MEIANQDMINNISHEQICAINRNLRVNLKDLQYTSCENKYLQEIVDDYIKHCEEEKDEKKAQYEALHVLSDYIDNNVNEIKSVKYLMQEVKQDQSNIIKEIARLKRELQSL
tara:strand:+ start:184 stop:519 length:336 start_codon:yes stop_codon:yes gene_type:complete